MADRYPLAPLCLLLCSARLALVRCSSHPAAHHQSHALYLTELLQYDSRGWGSHSGNRRCLRFPRGGALPRVANHRSINLEALLAQSRIWCGLALGPVPHAGPRRLLGIPVFCWSLPDFASLATEMRSLGRLLGTRQKADQQADAYLAEGWTR